METGYQPQFCANIDQPLLFSKGTAPSHPKRHRLHIRATEHAILRQPKLEGQNL